ncbi:putative deoxyribonuclease RhsC [Lysinibacillus sphaericus]|nr:putative deoxyribonuclease RhsC [Lysinibacillus sphaericus]
MWDGNTILHEFSKQNVADTFDNLKSSQTDTAIADNLVTWVFNEGFVPSAKITNEGHYSIISDYLGTPVEAYDEQGHKVWSAELDVYGRVKEFTGDKDFIPFRYQGQYEDVEIGLYYNRFRYYDPEQGNYTQVDPIGLAGGNPTLYSYVANPNYLLDPLGLEKCRLSAADKKTLGPAPTDMVKPHYHHIVREKAPKNWDSVHRKYITDSQDIIKKHGIGLNDDLRNFTWAQNGGGAHTKKAAKFVHDTLVEANKEGKEAVEEALKLLGKNAKRGKFF